MIGYFGDESSHTYACARQNFGGERLLGYSTIAAAVEAVERGEIECAIVPIENSVGGSVGETLDALKRCAVYIHAQYFCPISHSLISVKGATLGGIKRVFSHPQALAQCRGFLEQALPNAAIVPVASTSQALADISSSEDAAIARGALSNQIELVSHVEDEKSNTTRFVRLAKAPSIGGKNASIIFEVEHRSGELLKILEILARHALNLNKLESRPTRGEAFRYWFYVEFGCPKEPETLEQVIKDLRERTGKVKFLGSF